MRGQAIDTILLKGGLDLETPAVQVKSGRALVAVNFEPKLSGGYSWMKGYERFDGRASPSAAVYYLLTVDDTSFITTGTTVTGDSSGASGYVVVVDSDENTIGITNLSGNFTDGETLNTGVATLDGTEDYLGQEDAATHFSWLALAQSYYRSQIAAVPGSGPVRGVVLHDGVVYAFRDNVAGSEVLMYKATSSGWTQITFPKYIEYDGGAFDEGDITEGMTINGQTSNATAVVRKVVKNGGSYGADAFGYLVVTDVTGTWQDNENIRTGATVLAVVDGTLNNITLTTGGRYEFVSHNFFATSGTYNLYGCDGVNPGFEFDGTYYTPILLNTQAADVPEFNKPHLVAAHGGYLYFAFPSGSLQRSVAGTPLEWSGFLGAGEYGMGDDITGLASQPGGALAIYTRRNVFALFGSGADSELKLISGLSGAQLYSVQLAGTVYGLDDRGITRLDRVQNFGDFESSTVSRAVKKIIERKNDNIGSVLVRNKNQYRLFFDDGTGLIMTNDAMAGEYERPQFCEFTVPFTLTCVSNSKDTDGAERIFAGDDEGYVYELEKGTSHDGEDVEGLLTTPYTHGGSPLIRKTYRHLRVDIEAESDVTLSVLTELNYGSSQFGDSLEDQLSVVGQPGYWDVDNWSEFYWDGQLQGSDAVDLTGTGYNLATTFYLKSGSTQPFTLQTLYLYSIKRRLHREH